MRSLFAIISLSISFTGVFSTRGSPLSVQKFAGDVKPNSFIVSLKPGTDKTTHLEALEPRLGDSRVTHDYDASFLNAFAGTFTQATLDLIRVSPDVDHIAEDGVFHTMATVATQTDAPWGLARLSQTPRLLGSALDLNFSYFYHDAAGSGVDIYGIDTGIFTEHSDFGGRATWGATFGGYPDADGNGHGTHTAGTAAGTRWGVAKLANLIAVKVLSDQGSGFVSDIISGLSFVASSASASGRPSVATMSLGGPPSVPLDQAVTSLVGSGVHVAVAAGNSGTDASGTSPARAPAVNTIGATTFADTCASFSNFGPVVDIWAPGMDITSTWIGSSNATNRISGTSMSTPHVAGLIAYLISVYGNSPPASMTSFLHTLGTDNILVGCSGELARNDIGILP